MGAYKNFYHRVIAFFVFSLLQVPAFSTLYPRALSCSRFGVAPPPLVCEYVAEGQQKTHHDGGQVLAFEAADGQLHGAVHGSRDALRDQPVQVYGPA